MVVFVQNRGFLQEYQQFRTCILRGCLRLIPRTTTGPDCYYKRIPTTSRSFYYCCSWWFFLIGLKRPAGLQALSATYAWPELLAAAGSRSPWFSNCNPCKHCWCSTLGKEKGWGGPSAAVPDDLPQRFIPGLDTYLRPDYKARARALRVYVARHPPKLRPNQLAEQSVGRTVVHHRTEKACCDRHAFVSARVSGYKKAGVHH